MLKVIAVVMVIMQAVIDLITIITKAAELTKDRMIDKTIDSEVKDKVKASVVMLHQSRILRSIEKKKNVVLVKNVIKRIKKITSMKKMKA